MNQDNRSVTVHIKDGRAITLTHEWSEYRAWAVPDLLILHGQSPTLGAVGALLLCHPRMAKDAGFKLDIATAAQVMYGKLVAAGWSAPAILQAGGSALAFVLERLPVLPGSPEVQEAADFFDGQDPGNTPAGS